MAAGTFKHGFLAINIILLSHPRQQHSSATQCAL